MMTDREKRAAFELYIWKYQGGTNFLCQLFDLIGKADSRNKERIAKGFPDEVAVFNTWYNSHDVMRFWEVAGLGHLFTQRKNDASGA